MDTPYYYYAVLEVPHDATLDDVKKAYRRKALKYHPDKCRDPSAADKFKEVNHAFQVLSDSEKRSHYDNFGGVERPEIPVRINKPYMDFCEGVGVGIINLLGNAAFAVLFGAPFGMSLTGFLLFGQALAVWQMLPDTMEQAKELKNWMKSIGVVFSPLVLALTATAATGGALFTGGKLAIEFTKDKVGELSSSITSVGRQIHKTLKEGRRMRVKASKKSEESLDEWFVVDDSKSKKSSPKKNETIVLPPTLPPIAAAPIPPKMKPIPLAQHNPDEDWVLLDDF